MNCTICPRKCNIDRSIATGYCGVGDKWLVSKVMMYRHEEPIVSGERGSGAFFFAGCNLRCVFCQNYPSSTLQHGIVMSDDELEYHIMRLIERGAQNINFVTPTHYADKLAVFLEKVKPRIGVPIVYNSGGYECVESLRTLQGLVDVYLPDFKYVDSDLSLALSNAADYYQVAVAAIDEMYRQVGAPVIADGIIVRGLLIRHLVLPGHYRDSISVVGEIAERWHDAYISLMRQYSPQFNRSSYKELNRKLTSYEYGKVLAEARRLKLDGYMQLPDCIGTMYTPDFDKEVLDYAENGA